MSTLIFTLIGVVLFIVAYNTYGTFISKKLGVSDKIPTPAHELQDGIDYVPAKAPVLLGHHFASIAGAGPILGPVIASQFGWLPVYLWIIIGGIFLGGVHDFGSLVASLRHQGKSIGQILESYLGLKGKRLFIIFAYLTMILVIAVFCKIVATTFVNVPAVASSSSLFIIIAVFFGFAIYRRNLPLAPTTLIGVVLLAGAIFLGSKYPAVIYKSFLSPEAKTSITQLEDSGKLASSVSPIIVKKAMEGTEFSNFIPDIAKAEAKAKSIWIYILLVYVLIAATTPVWILLQPRDYLNSFLLYALLAGGIIGLFFARPSLTLPELTHFKTNLGYLFPVLFVTVACGAISGFHSLVSSGTTAKQINKDSDSKFVGYGGMLIESVLALIALFAAATMLKSRYTTLYTGGDFIAIFSEGVGWFMSKIPLLNIEKSAGITFTGLAVSAFALTTLDTCTRLARFSFQEFFDRKDIEKKSILATNRWIGTIVTILLSLLFIFSGSSSSLWPIFGSANQLLAALALLAITAWLGHSKKANWFTKIPMIFMYLVTLSALFTLVIQNIMKNNYALSLAGIFLIIVAFWLAYEAQKQLKILHK